MSADPFLLLACALVILVAGVPSFLAFGGGAAREIPVIAAAVVTASVGWLLLGWDAPTSVFQGAIAGVSIASVAAPLVDKLGRRGALLAGPALVAAVIVPLGVGLFDVRSGLLAAHLGALDFAGSTVMAVVPAVIGAVMASSDAPAGEHRDAVPRQILATVGIVMAFTAAVLGSELFVDDTSLRLAAAVLIGAAGGAVGWVLGTVLLVGARHPVGISTGLVAGTVTVLPAPLWVDPVALLVVAVLAALLGRIVAGRLSVRRRVLVGALGVPAAIALLAAGAVSDGRGLLASGQPSLVIAQMTTIAVAVALAGAGTLGVRKLGAAVSARRALSDARATGE